MAPVFFFNIGKTDRSSNCLIQTPGDSVSDVIVRERVLVGVMVVLTIAIYLLSKMLFAL